MCADFSRRPPFDPKKHYVKSYSQQGRVWLDSDWNESEGIREYQDEERTLDLVGPSGVPAPYKAFQITAIPNSADFGIGGGAGPAGDFYVDGILCRNENPTTYSTQPDFPSPPAFPKPAPGAPSYALAYLEVWEREITYLEDPDIREIALGGPDTAVRAKTIAQVKYLPLPGPLSCVDAAKLLPSPLGNGTLTTLQAPPPADPTDICRLPEEITFTGRENRLYRVEIHEGGDVLGGGASGIRFAMNLNANAAAGALSIVLAGTLTQAQADNVRRSVTVTLSDTNGQRETVLVTSVDPDAKTLRLARGLHNAFAQSNTTVTGGAALFKWSRSNAAFAAGVTAVSPDRLKLTLTMLGRDDATALRQGDLVEISDDVNELGAGRGHLTYLAADPNPDDLTVTLVDALPSTFDPQQHLTLRRWDGNGFASATFDELGTPQMDLGDGVHIQFGGQGLRTGEYWQFIARVIDGSVESLTAAPPHGIDRHRCALAVVQWTQTFIAPQPFSPPLFSPPASSSQAASPQDSRASLQTSPPGSASQARITIGIGGGGVTPVRATVIGSVLSDCRPKIPLLTRMLQLHYVGGDAQEAVSSQPLALPLQVGVTNGPFALPGATVQFFSLDPGGRLQAGGQSGQFVNAVTDGDGVAACSWTPPATPDVYQVSATLVLSPEDAILCDPLEVIFHCSVGACCIDVRPADLVTTTLQEIVDAQQGRNVKICLAPGRYELLLPLVLTAAHQEMTIEGCARGVVIASDSSVPFQTGMIHLLGTTGVTLRNLELETPQVTGAFASSAAERTAANLPPLFSDVDLSVAVRIVEAEDCTIEECRFTFPVRRQTVLAGGEPILPPIPFGAAVLAAGTLKELSFRNNVVAGGAAPEAFAGVVLAPAIFDSSGHKRYRRSVVDGVRIENNQFSGLSHAVLLCGVLKGLSIRENSISDCEHGIVVISAHWFPSIAAVDAAIVTTVVEPALIAQARTLRTNVLAPDMAVSALALATYTAFHPSIAIPLAAYATLPTPLGGDTNGQPLNPKPAGAPDLSSNLVLATAKYAALADPVEFATFDETVVGSALTTAWSLSPDSLAVSAIAGDLLSSTDLMTPFYNDPGAAELTADLSHNNVSRHVNQDNRPQGVALLTLHWNWIVPPANTGTTTTTGTAANTNPAAAVNVQAEALAPAPLFGAPGTTNPPETFDLALSTAKNGCTVSSNEFQRLARFFPTALMLFDRRCTVTGNLIQNENVPSPAPPPPPEAAPPPIATAAAASPAAAAVALPEFAPSLVIIPLPDRTYPIVLNQFFNTDQTLRRRSTDVAGQATIVPAAINTDTPLLIGRYAGITTNSPLIAVAITGNVFVGWPILPIRTFRHSDLGSWFGLNTIVD